MTRKNRILTTTAIVACALTGFTIARDHAALKSQPAVPPPSATETGKTSLAPQTGTTPVALAVADQVSR